MKGLFPSRLAKPAASGIVAVAAILSAAVTLADRPTGVETQKTWAIKADYIEACSCSLFCSCYFNMQPEGGKMCNFNNAVKITEGHVGGVRVDGLKVWMSGDLGGDFTKGMKGSVITFEPGTTKEQEKALMYLIGKVYPVKWGKVVTDRSRINWERNGMNGRASLANGKGSVVLKGVPGADGKQATIHNLKYWGAQKNDGFELAHSVHNYKGHGYNYSHKGKNGFFIHIESEGSI